MRSRIASVGGWNVDARDAALSAGRFSATVTGIPASATSSAAVSPTGPAPATSTWWLSFTRRSRRRRTGWDRVLDEVHAVAVATAGRGDPPAGLEQFAV